jgi:hypothetical protein
MRGSDARARAAVQPLVARMPPFVTSAARSRMYARRVAEALQGLPRASLDALAARLSSRVGEAEVRAVIDGIGVVVRYTLRTAGSSSSKWTEVAVGVKDIPEHGGLPIRFDIDVRPASLDDAKSTSAGRLRDLVLGDEQFDAAFVVEAAPEDIMRALFDHHARREMLALLPLRLFTSSESAFEINREGWIDDVDVLERMARLATYFGGRLVAAAAEAAADRRRAPHDRGYRDAPPTDVEIARERDDDLRKLDEQRMERGRREARIVFIVVLALIVLIAVIVGAFQVFAS